MRSWFYGSWRGLEGFGFSFFDGVAYSAIGCVVRPSAKHLWWITSSIVLDHERANLAFPLSRRLAPFFFALRNTNAKFCDEYCVIEPLLHPTDTVTECGYKSRYIYVWIYWYDRRDALVHNNPVIFICRVHWDRRLTLCKQNSVLWLITCHRCMFGTLLETQAVFCSFVCLHAS